MRILIATVAALSLGACAAEPRGPTIASVAAQVFGAFGAFGAVDQNCAVSTSPGQNRVAPSKCFDAKQTAQTAEASAKQRVSAHPVVERSSAPKLNDPREPATI